MSSRILRRMDETGIPLLAARVILGVMMVFMGWSKAWDPVTFLKLLREYHLVPDGAYVLLNLIAVTLPWIEIVCGVCLLTGVMIRGASLALVLLLTGFTFAIAARALEIHQAEGIPFGAIHFDCGCGTGDVYIKYKIPENLALLALSLIGLLSRSRRFCMSARLPRGSQKAPLESSAEAV